MIKFVFEFNGWIPETNAYNKKIINTNNCLPSLLLYKHNSTLHELVQFETKPSKLTRNHSNRSGLCGIINRKKKAIHDKRWHWHCHSNQVTTQGKHLHRLKQKLQLTSRPTVSEQCTRYGLERIETVQRLGGTAVGRDSEIETTAKHFNHINNWWGRPSHGINESKGESLMSERLWHSDLRLAESEQDIASQK